MGFVRRQRAAPKDLEVRWPEEYPAPGSHFAADQVLSGIRRIGIPVAIADIQQKAGSVVIFEVASRQGSELVAFDHDDSPELDEDLAARVLVYLKQQFAPDGYAQPNVIPAGYMPANVRLYRYLPALRAIRRLGLFRYDVYCRFGLKWGGQEMRIKAHELLSARTDFRYEGSLFRYPGGPDKVPYRKHLFEIPRAKVCVDLPGKGDFATRLVDYLAIGACVVKPPTRSRLPVRLVDGVHVVYCAPDLSDLGDVCAQLVRDDEERETIARNARDFFDRYLDRRRLAQRYVDEIIDARGAAPRRRPEQAAAPGISRVRRRVRVPAHLLAQAVVVLVALLSLSVGLPEALGDRPYDPRPSVVVHEVKVHLHRPSAHRSNGG